MMKGRAFLSVNRRAMLLVRLLGKLSKWRVADIQISRSRGRYLLLLLTVLSVEDSDWCGWTCSCCSELLIHLVSLLGKWYVCHIGQRLQGRMDIISVCQLVVVLIFAILVWRWWRWLLLEAWIVRSCLVVIYLLMLKLWLVIDVGGINETIITLSHLYMLDYFLLFDCNNEQLIDDQLEDRRQLCFLCFLWFMGVL